MSFSKLKNKNRWIILIVVFLIFIGIMTFLSYAKLGTPNFVRAGTALISIQKGNTDCKEVQMWPNRVILASPDNAAERFETYLAEEGYTVTDRAGAVFHVEKGGEKEQVTFKVNGYYATWVWESAT